MGKVDEIIDKLIGVEGGYVDHASDRGGKTRYGIAESTARKQGYTGDMDELPIDLARAIYRDQYWIGPGLDRVHVIAPDVAAYLFDYGVHSGPATAIKALQRGLNVLSRGAREHERLGVDGQIGPATRAALLAHVGKRGEEAICKVLLVLRGSMLIDLAERDKTQQDFIYGWLSRI